MLFVLAPAEKGDSSYLARLAPGVPSRGAAFLAEILRPCSFLCFFMVPFSLDSFVRASFLFLMLFSFDLASRKSPISRNGRALSRDVYLGFYFHKEEENKRATICLLCNVESVTTEEVE